jgi:hypothetical protein
MNSQTQTQSQAQAKASVLLDDGKLAKNFDPAASTQHFAESASTNQRKHRRQAPKSKSKIMDEFGSFLALLQLSQAEFRCLPLEKRLLIAHIDQTHYPTTPL